MSVPSDISLFNYSTWSFELRQLSGNRKTTVMMLCSRKLNSSCQKCWFLLMTRFIFSKCQWGNLEKWNQFSGMSAVTKNDGRGFGSNCDLSISNVKLFRRCILKFGECRRSCSPILWGYLIYYSNCIKNFIPCHGTTALINSGQRFDEVRSWQWIPSPTRPRVSKYLYFMLRRTDFNFVFLFSVLQVSDL